jgi:deoxyribonuclease (pyrimidine dimer)
MRINCIDVADLTDQHLRAEWVEFLMLSPYIKRALSSKDGLILTSSNNYILGTGHARFFYNKLNYVKNRYFEIECEMIDRGFKPTPTLELDDLPMHLFKDWEPNKSDKIINLNRIIARISDKPLWYKLKNQQITDWVEFYEKKYEFKYVFDVSHYGNKIKSLKPLHTT